MIKRQTDKQIIDAWCDAVLDGKVPASRFVKMAIKRHRADLKRYRRKTTRYRFDRVKAEFAIEFFRRFLVHTIGEYAGRPFEPSPSQLFILWNVFGWRERDTGLRRFRRVFITVARKWGKSTFAAGVALLCLYADNPIEPGAQIYVAATKHDQASIVHSQAVEMVRKNPGLLKRADIKKMRDKYLALILWDEPYAKSVFKPLGSDSKTLDGLNPHVVIKDELHEWKRHHADMKQKLETGGGSRRQPLDITISTAGDDQSEFYNADLAASETMLEASERGEATDERLFAFVAKLDTARPCDCDGECDKCEGGTIPGDDPFDESNWPKANPDIGTTPSWEYMRDQAERAQREPAFKNTFLRYHCNVMVTSRIKLVNVDQWSAGAVDSIDFSQAEVLCGGFDLGWRDDLAAVVVAGRFNIDGQIKYGFQAKTYSPELNKHRNTNDEPWATYVRQGWLDITPGNATDITRVRNDVLQLSNDLDVGQWRFDQWNAKQIGNELEEHGLTAVSFRQSATQYNEPLRALISAIAEGRTMFVRDDLFSWQVGNAVAKENNLGQIMPDKVRSADKIDTFVAAIMAFSGVMEGLDDVTQQPSDWYESHELEIG